MSTSRLLSRELVLHEEQIPETQASARAPVNHVPIDDEYPTVETPAVVDLEPTSLGEPAVADQKQAAFTERNIGAQPVVDDQPTVKPQAADLDEPSAEELTLLQELTEVTAVEALPADELETASPDKSDEKSPSSRIRWSTCGQMRMTMTSLFGIGTGLRMTLRRTRTLLLVTPMTRMTRMGCQRRPSKLPTFPLPI